MDILTTIMEFASFTVSAALSGVTCWWIARHLRLSPPGLWTMVGLIGGGVIGFCVAPLSFVTFGWFGAAFGSYFGRVGPSIMTVSVPVSVALGAALVSGIVAAVLFGAIAAVQLALRRCPLLGRRPAAG